MALESEKIFRHGSVSSNIYSFTQLDGISSTSLIDFSTRVTWCVTNLSPHGAPTSFREKWKPKWERGTYGCDSPCRPTPKTFSPILVYQQDLTNQQLKTSLLKSSRLDNPAEATPELRQRLLLNYRYFQGADLYYNCPDAIHQSSTTSTSNDLCVIPENNKDICSDIKTRKYRCQYCNVTCTNNGQLKGHLRVHTGEKPYTCDYMNCGRSFARNEELTRHRRIHSGIRPHQCATCGKYFGRKDHLNKHIKTHLKTAEKKNYICKVSRCEQRYTRSDALARHQWSTHGIKAKSSKWKNGQNM